jgi:hypothetical protein
MLTMICSYTSIFSSPIIYDKSCLKEDSAMNQRPFSRPPQPFEKATQSVWQQFSRLLDQITSANKLLLPSGSGLLQGGGAADQKLSVHADYPPIC